MKKIDDLVAELRSRPSENPPPEGGPTFVEIIYLFSCVKITKSEALSALEESLLLEQHEPAEVKKLVRVLTQRDPSTWLSTVRAILEKGGRLPPSDSAN